MTAQREWGDWPWLTCRARKMERNVASKGKKSTRKRKHAGWVLELAFMLALALLLPRPGKRK